MYSRVGCINKDCEEESKGGGEHERREPTKRVQVHFALRNFENKTSLGHRLFGGVLVILAGHRNFTTVE